MPHRPDERDVGWASAHRLARNPVG